MKVRCNALKVSIDQLYVLGKNAEAKNHFAISIGKDYVVFGLTFSYNNMEIGCFVQILSDNEHLVHVPVILFDIVDSRLSSYWEIKTFPDGDITLWPSSFYREYYHDDLTEDVKDVIEDFNIVKQKILNEF